MRDFILGARRLSIVAGAALALAGCGGGETATNAANDLESDLIYDVPANDASAMELAANATGDLVPIDNVTNAFGDEADTGGSRGNSVESNVTGM